MPQAQQLGRYHLLDRIAYGGMAEIYRAKTFDSNGAIHLVAIKRLLNHLITDDEFLEMLVDEAKVTATLTHPNIARTYEFGHVGDEYFLAMEYIDGKDVRALLEKARQTGKPMPPEHAAWITMEVATALHAAHTTRDAQGAALRIVHRDVSPSNVLCSYRGDVKLCDFGIAKATLTRVQTKTGVIKGKVKYMSPEQAMGRKLDHRSDVFSLGSVLYEMLTLQAPFQAPTEVELIFAVRDARKRPVRDLSSECPPELQIIVDKAMTRARASRYQSGLELAEELRTFLDAYKPGYRRSHFSRYMRKVFMGEIEREQRVLEGYTIDHADSTQVGDNLIADALGPDAPFARFTPVHHANFPVQRAPLNAPMHSAMPAAGRRRTDELARNAVLPNAPHIAPTPPRNLHDQQTRLISRESLHEQGTYVFSAEDIARRGRGRMAPVPSPAAPPSGRVFRVDEGTDDSTDRDRPAAAREDSGSIDLDPDDLVEDLDDLHAQSTRILELPAQPTQIQAPTHAHMAPPPRAPREVPTPAPLPPPPSRSAPSPGRVVPPPSRVVPPPGRAVAPPGRAVAPPGRSTSTPSPSRTPSPGRATPPPPARAKPHRDSEGTDETSMPLDDDDLEPV